MADEGKGIALAVLGIVAVLAVVGLVMLFTGSATGRFVEESAIAQYEPNEACASIGGTLIGLEGGLGYDYRGPFLAVCNVNGQVVRTPVVGPRRLF